MAACSALTIVAAIHLYWAAGGTAGKAGAVPSRGGVPVLSPSPLSTVLVGVALLGMAVVAGSTAGLLPRFLPTGLLRGASAALALVFAVRAVGEFRYVGFFKRVRGTVFARRDTCLYSPLCLLLALLIALVALACIFRRIPAGHSDASQPVIPTEASHPFRGNSATPE